jgi:TPR repeat protein
MANTLQENIKTSTSNWFVDKMSLYQSANSDTKTIKKNFVIRQQEFETVIEGLVSKKIKDPLQHELILGRRGSGKSTLLRRIQAEVDEDTLLKKKYIAITLPEEQAAILRLFDLWEEVLKELSIKLDEQVILKSYSEFTNSHTYTRYLYEVIHKILAKNKKKLVLLLDNFDRILTNFSDDGSLLREILMNHNDIAIIAGSARKDEHFWRYDQPFYEFFRVHRLEALDAAEIETLLNHWSDVMQLPQLANFAKNNIGKLEVIRILTDGLPRTLQFFIQILLQNTSLQGYEYLQKVMDNASARYQDQLNSLPAAQRKIILEMAFLWEACGTKELVEKCRMESKLISANIKQLNNAGIVDTIITDKKNHLYRISERFFNMWLIVTQGGQEQKRNAQWLSTFLETWFDTNELLPLPDKQLANPNTNNDEWDIAISKTREDALLHYSKNKRIKTKPDAAIQMPKMYAINTSDKHIHQVQESNVPIDGLGNANISEEISTNLYNKGELFEAKYDYENAAKCYLQAIEKGSVNALKNLAMLYHNQNIMKEKALQCIKEYNNQFPGERQGMQNEIIISLWNNVFDNLERKIENLVNDFGFDHLEFFLSNLLYHEQLRLVYQLFTSTAHGNELQKRYKPLYYAVLLLNNNTGNNLTLRIPPEIKPTVKAIVEKVLKRQKFYNGF